MSIDEIERRLAAARDRWQEVSKRMSLQDRAWWQEYDTVEAVVMSLERELAAAKGEEHAVPLDFPVTWDRGAPLPQLLRNDYRCFLAFFVYEADPNWDGTYATVKDPGDDSVESLALVEFRGCVSAKLGSPNDEVFNGHPLHGKGLDGYTAQEVQHSRWLAELEAINSVHRGYDPAFWRGLHHYVLWFHDTTFECVAESFKVELYRESMADLLARVCQRLLS
jgi:hypothetical protein